MHCHLLLPDLLWPEPEDQEAYPASDAEVLAPALTALFAHADLQRHPPQAAESWLAQRLGLAEQRLADLRRQGEPQALAPVGDIDGGQWLCADPIHLQLMQEQMIVAGSEQLALSPTEARQLAADINQTFADIGRLHVVTPTRWYLQLHQAHPFPAPPLSAVAGRRLSSQLPTGPAHRPLLAFLLEAQMLLHSHPLNQQRSAEGKLTANSLWLWGDSIPSSAPPTPLPIDQLWGQGPQLAGSARAQGLASHPLPTDGQHFLAHANVDQKHLLQLDVLVAANHNDDGAAWQAALRQLDRDWFEPLYQAWRKGRLGSLAITASGSFGLLEWQVERGGWWRRLRQSWQKPTPLPTLARQLASEAIPFVVTPGIPNK